MNRARTRNLILVCTLTLFAVTSSFAGTGGIRKSANAVPDEYIVVLQKDIPNGEVHGLSRRIARENGGNVRKIWTTALKGFFVRMTEKDAEKLSRHPAVSYVEENASLSLASTTPTNVDPALCDLPDAQNCTTTTDNRMWHLDRLDQDSAVPSNSFSYCTTGSGVRIYIVDTGVHGTHSEFLLANGSSRVETGYNATVDTEEPIEFTDPWPANNPCGGWNTPAVAPMWDAERAKEAAQLNLGHGTGVASLAAGKKNGIAKEATIVPVNIWRCDGAKPRYRQPDHAYTVGDLVFDGAGTAGDGSHPNSYWRAITTGQSENVAAISWTGAFGSVRTDGTVHWQRYLQANASTEYTVQMLLEALDWILNDPNRTDKSLVSLSTSKPLQIAAEADSMFEAVQNLTAAGVHVIASANNNDADACNRAPAAFSRGNPNGYDDKVITVGGTMLVNDPERTGYSNSQPTVDGRWTCADPSNCNANGSNGGPCVTLFAPAHEITVASNYGANSYRGRIVDVPGQSSQSNSGTSWSAPLVAGVVAGYLQSGAQSLNAIYDRLIADSQPILDETNRHPLDGIVQVTGTPNLLLRAGSVHITAHPQSTPASTTGSTVLSATATPSTGVTYQWFKVNAEFDLTKKRGAADSDAIGGATSSTYTVATPGSSTGYWVRVTGCGATDSDIAVVVPRAGAPSNLVATATGTSVSLSWSAGSGAEKYQIERKVSGQPWTIAGTVDASLLTFSDTPTASGGMVIYRVLSAKGVSYLPANNLALSDPSNNDIANVNSYTYETLAVAPAFSTFKAQMLIELRQAVNSLAVAAETTAPYTTPELELSSLQNQTIRADYLTSLMDNLNDARNAAGLGNAQWTLTPTPNAFITTRTYVDDLRNALE